MRSAVRTALVAGAVSLGLAGAVLGYRAWLVPTQKGTVCELPAGPPGPDFAEAFVEIAVASPLAETELAVWQDRTKLSSLVATFAPGGAGEAGRFREAAQATLRSDQTASFEVMSAERFILPPVEDADLVAPQLSADERARFFASKSVLVLRIRGTGGPPHFAARLGFGLATAVAEKTHGFVEDEVRRRVETPAQVKARSVLPDVRSAFNEESISIELDPDGDGGSSARLLSLGMRRYGAPDLQFSHVSAGDAAGLSRLLTGLCRLVAERRSANTLTVGPDDLGPGVAAAPFEVRFGSAPMATGNPENELFDVEMDPATRTRLARRLELATTADAGLHAETEDDLQARLGTVRAALPGVLARWRKEHGELFLLVDFPANEPGSVESMWVRAETVDPGGALRGSLANEPAHVDTLHHGDPVNLGKPVVSGYRLELPSGARVAFP